jgi:chromosome segregation ATPase
MPPHPTSPSSLLWAHQLKLEHTHLLSRLTTLQTVTASLSTGLTSATATSDRVTRLESSATNLGARVAAIEEDDKDVKEWIERLDDAQRARTREEGLKVERLGRKVGEVLVREKEWGRLEGIVLGLGRRVEELERGVKGEREREREKGLSRKNDPDDVKVLARRLDAVEAGRGEVVRKAEELRERVEGLEKGKWEWENEKWRLGRKVETREKALETRDRLSQAVPDSERTTQVDLETVPFPSSTQDIPAAIMETIERRY